MIRSYTNQGTLHRGLLRPCIQPCSVQGEGRYWGDLSGSSSTERKQLYLYPDFIHNLLGPLFRLTRPCTRPAALVLSILRLLPGNMSTMIPIVSRCMCIDDGRLMMWKFLIGVMVVSYRPMLSGSIWGYVQPDHNHRALNCLRLQDDGDHQSLSVFIACQSRAWVLILITLSCPHHAPIIFTTIMHIHFTNALQAVGLVFLSQYGCLKRYLLRN